MTIYRDGAAPLTTPRITVVTAGLGQPSSTRLLADRLAAATTKQLVSAGRTPLLDVIELRDHAHDLANNLVTGFAPPALREAIEQVTTADGLIAVTPIFTASYSGLFKMFFDVLEPDSLTGMPVVIGATGGTPRHSLALDHAVRPLFTYLRAIVVPTGVYAATDDWGAADGEHALAGRIDRGGRELADLVAGRPARRVADPYAEPTPFEQLLAGQG
ncbi:FMN reductase [Aldersonia sp. NBC_00410]|uniref:FMN reductase n=1 Tax=Aldersonia sp. NBC_00410 TaxID=2975954 RepID=UPI002257A812|nr:FMN reductase [Aldersonia sp. NBC_00410]MCX5042185.1 FMN reductase [Aldersonia sp. NBC_00410]